LRHRADAYPAPAGLRVWQQRESRGYGLRPDGRLPRLCIGLAMPIRLKSDAQPRRTPW